MINIILYACGISVLYTSTHNGSVKSRLRFSRKIRHGAHHTRICWWDLVGCGASICLVCARSFRWHLLCQQIELWIRFFVKVCLCAGVCKVYEMKCFFLFVYFYVQTFLVCVLCVYVIVILILI